MTDKRLRFLSVTLVVLLGCGDSTAPPPPCEGAIDVRAGSFPLQFSWLPACGISALTVTTVAASPIDERVIWGWTVSEQHPVGPGIVYGFSPDGADVWAEPEELGMGTEYRVLVRYTVGGDVVVASGSRTFYLFLPD
jgi:hypothetical protein